MNNVINLNMIRAERSIQHDMNELCEQGYLIAQTIRFLADEADSPARFLLALLMEKFYPLEGVTVDSENETFMRMLGLVPVCSQLDNPSLDELDLYLANTFPYPDSLLEEIHIDSAMVGGVRIRATGTAPPEHYQKWEGVQADEHFLEWGQSQPRGNDVRTFQTTFFFTCLKLLGTKAGARLYDVTDVDHCITYRFTLDDDYIDVWFDYKQLEVTTDYLTATGENDER